MLVLAVADKGSGGARRDSILSAALQRFADYGYRRTAMEDIAQATGISRPALYLHFKNKEEIFRALALALNQQALVAAECAARTDQPLAARLEQILEAKLGTFFEIIHAAAHARELLDENSRVCGDISAMFRKKHAAVLRRVLETAAQRKELALPQVGLSVRAAADLLLDCASGLESNPALTPTTFRRRLHDLTHVMVRGLVANPGSKPDNPSAKSASTGRSKGNTARKR